MYSPSEYPASLSACENLASRAASPCPYADILMREIFRMCSRAVPTSVDRIPDCLFDVGYNFIAFFTG